MSTELAGNVGVNQGDSLLDVVFRLWWRALGLVALVLLTYSQNVSHQFLLIDDGVYIFRNYVVRGGVSSENLTQTLGVFAHEVPTWHPLTWWSLMLDWQIWGGWPGGFLITNMLLHAMTSVLLFAALAIASRDVLFSWIVAALFALHPLQAECVAWASERKGLLAGLFGMASLASYALFARGGDGRWKWYVLSIGCFCCSVMAKQSLVMWPVVLLLLDWWPLQRWSGDSLPDGGHLFLQNRRNGWLLLLEKVPFACIAAASMLVAYWAQQVTGAMKSIQYPLWVRVANVPLSYGAYLRKTFVPFDLAIFYPHPMERIDLFAAGVWAAVLVMLTALIWFWRRRIPGLAVGYAFFVVSIFPLAGLIQLGDRQYADRYMYIPIIGLFMATVSCMKLAISRWIALQWQPTAKVGLVCGAIAVSGLSWVQAGYFRDTRAAFERALEVNGPDEFICSGLGLALMDLGDYAGAVEQLKQSCQQNPKSTRALELLARCYELLGERQRAIQTLQVAVTLDPQGAGLIAQLASLRFDQGELPVAAELALTAVELDPQVETGWLIIGKLAMLQQNCQRAIDAFRRATMCQYKRQSALGQVLLAQSFADCQLLDEAEQTLVRLLQEEPKSAAAHHEFGVLQMIRGNRQVGLLHLEQACQLAPDWEPARQSLNRARQESGGQR